jgi:predicted CXXCH cytochrome family protein
MSMYKLGHGRRFFWIMFLALGSGLIAFAIGLPVTKPAAAAPAAQSTPEGLSSDVCLACHNQLEFQTQLPSGEAMSIRIDRTAFNASVHNQNDVSCVDCHTDISAVPHAAGTAKNLREVAIQYSATCQQCHSEEADKSMHSVHQEAMDKGNANAAVCSDCHNPHTQKPIAEMKKSDIPNTCARCHSAIFETYKTSVHGAALIGEGNADVASCIDCHGVHDIQNPITAQFRNAVPQLCAKCHTNSEVMDKYGISTHVLDTYVSDFHGTTVTLFQSTSPDQPTNKPVCVDCHGVHDIPKVDDPQHGIAIKQNLLLKCQRCHPGINENFPDAWLHHYIPSPDKAPLVYYVNLFYQIMIPAIIGGMLIFVISDFIRRLIERRKGVAH